jgi:hypothetical protein
LVAYRTGYARLPKRKEKNAKEPSRESETVHDRLAEFDRRPEDGENAAAAESVKSGSERTDREVVRDLDEIPGPLEERCKKARAIMNANIGACFVYLASISMLFSITHSQHSIRVNMMTLSRPVLKVGRYVHSDDPLPLTYIPALQDDPKYIKALQRRASANEKINTWSSLTNAQEGL